MKLETHSAVKLIHPAALPKHDAPPAMPDVQGRRDQRQLSIQRVGIKSLRYPLRVRVGGQVQSTVGTWTLDVSLPAEQKGAHMSRLMAWLESQDVRGVVLDADSLRTEIQTMLELLEADAGRIEVSFPFFIRKAAPVSGLKSLMEYDGCWVVERRAGQTQLSMQAVVPVKSLCPCSKEVSDDGAHNQRSHISLRVALKDGQGTGPNSAAPDWSEFVRFAEDQASSELWGLLKRPDEKWVTERAYANPKFVEDLIRDVAGALAQDSRFDGFRVEVVNHESIHAHDAYAVIEREPSA